MPCIVTDVGGCTELIKDGVNGYVVPLDMNFDINKIKKIPKCKEYDNHSLEDWLKYLGYNGKIDKTKIIQDFEKEGLEMKAKVKAIINFNDLEENIKRKVGDEFVVDIERAEYLVEHRAVEILEKIKPEPKKATIEIDSMAKEIFKEPTIEEKPKIIEKVETSVGTFGYGPVEVKETKLKTPKKKKSSKK